MNCVEFRRQLAIDPQATAADFVQHRAECPRCAEAHARALAFENNFARALNIAVPAQLAEAILLAQTTAERRRRTNLRRASIFAVAAMLVLAVGVVGMRVEAKPLSVQAVEHLYALGHTRCAYVNAPRNVWSNQHRRSAVRRTCKALGMELVELGPFAQSVEGGVQAADIVAAHGVTAAIANNDLVAIGLMQQLANRGLSVPDDISVVGVDDTFVASLCRPQLTTVRIPVEEIGALAVDLLLNVIQSGDKADTGTVEVDTQLIVRESTGPATTEVHWPSRPLPTQD